MPAIVVTWEQKLEIYRLRVRGRRQLQYLAKTYNCSVRTITNIINEVKKYNNDEKLGKKMIKRLMTEEYKELNTAGEKSAYVQTAPSRYYNQMQELQNIALEGIEKLIGEADQLQEFIGEYNLDIKNMRLHMNYKDARMVESLSKATLARAELVNKLTDIRLKIGTRFGIVDQSPKNTLIDQSSKSIHLNNDSEEQVIKKGGIIFADSIEEYEQLQQQYADETAELEYKVIDAEYSNNN